MNSNLDKFEELNHTQNMIFKRENNQVVPNKKGESNAKLNEHGHFFHSFNEYQITSFDVIPLYFLKHHGETESGEILPFSSNTLPIITNITRKDKDSIEITRIHLYTDYFNHKPYSTERILIKRNPSGKTDEVFLSFFEDKLKKEITTIRCGGDYSKVIKFKKFRNPNELLFFQNIFYYRCILDTFIYYKYLHKIPPKKEFNMIDMTYNEFLKNLF